MSPMLPPIPFATVTLAVGALCGVTGAQMMTSPDALPITTASASAAAARSAIVEDEGAGTGGKGKSVARASDGLFYVWAQVNGRPVRFLVDTGASVVVLRAADAAAVGARPRGGYGGTMETTGGATPMAWTRLDRLEVGGHKVSGLRAAVVRDGLSVSLLGANMLSKIGPVHIERNRLQLG